MNVLVKGSVMLLMSCLATQGSAFAEVQAVAGLKPATSRVQIPRAILSSSFDLKIDTNSDLLKTTHREPQDGVVTITSQSSPTMSLIAKAKTIPSRPDRIWVDVYLVNNGELSLLDLSMDLSENGSSLTFWPMPLKSMLRSKSDSSPLFTRYTSTQIRSGRDGMVFALAIKLIVGDD